MPDRHDAKRLAHHCAKGDGDPEEERHGGRLCMRRAVVEHDHGTAGWQVNRLEERRGVAD